VQWLSFDEPESRLKKAIKRGELLPAITSPERTTDLGESGHRADCLAALAFAIQDVARFKPISFKRIAQAISLNNQFEHFHPSSLLAKLHPQLNDYLGTELGWTENEKLWAALCLEFLSLALMAFQENDSQSQSDDGDSISFLTNVSNRIKASLDQQSVTECSAIVDLARNTFLQHYEEMRVQLSPEFLPEKLLMVEGQTEAILIPHFARLADFDLRRERILMISGGGANQVAKRFLTFRQTTRLPVACVLDGDAEAQYEIISQHIGGEDLLFSLESGELEDTFEITDFVQLLNRYLQSMTGVNAPSLVEFQALKKDLFSPLQKRTQTLNRIWRERSLGNFDKVEFAGFVAETIKSENEIPEEFAAMIQSIKQKWDKYKADTGDDS